MNKMGVPPPEKIPSVVWVEIENRERNTFWVKQKRKKERDRR
jgi:hypothetical protein